MFRSKNRSWTCANRECVGPAGLSSHPQAYGFHHPWIALGASPPIPVKKLQNTVSPISFSVGCISSDKQIGFLLHIILEQKIHMNVQKVYNVVCLLINSIGSKRFNLKAQSMHQTKWDRICPEKQQQQNVFFYPTELSKNITKKFTHS